MFVERLHHGINIYHDLIPLELCDAIIDDGGAKRDEGRIGPGILDREIRVSMNSTLKKPDLVDGMFEAFSKAWIDYSQQYELLRNIGEIVDTGYQVQESKRNQGFYAWHADGIADTSRVLGGIAYLNTVTEGGETEFRCGIRVPPRAGSIVLFPACWLLEHRGLIPLSNDKWVVTTFYCLERPE